MNAMHHHWSLLNINSISTLLAWIVCSTVVISISHRRSISMRREIS